MRGSVVRRPVVRRATALAAALLAGASAGGAQAPAPPRQAARAAVRAAADSIAAATVGRGRVAGMTLAVVRGRDTLLARAYGMADLEHEAPARLESVYEIGSITKQFTAAAVLQLVEAGKLSLADTITRYLDFPTQGHAVTVRHLLDHTAGIRSYTAVPGFGSIMSRRVPRDTLLALVRNEPFDFAPGEQMAYNNTAYYLLGLLIEKVSGESYADYVARHLFAPAGMTRSSYCDRQAIVRHRASGYGVAPDGTLRRADHIDMGHPYAAGALCATALDLVRWNRALHGGRIVSPASLARLTAPSALADGTPLRYGFGLAVSDVGGRRAAHHGGDIPGYTTYDLHLPDDTLDVIVLLNTLGPVRPDPIAARLAEAALGGPAAAKPVTELRPPAERYAGTYRWRDVEVRVFEEEGVLKAQRGPRPPGALIHRGGDRFEIPGAGRLDFEVRDGRAVRLRIDNVFALMVLERR